LLAIYRDLIPKAAEAGIPNVITFSGNREGLSDEEGLENCAQGLEPLLALAEEHGVTLIMELLNSKVDHPDYQCDHSDWGVALCEKLGSARFKLLYDIYHMQIMEGNVMATIKRFSSYFGHYHTAGCPGRNELDTYPRNFTTPLSLKQSKQPATAASSPMSSCQLGPTTNQPSLTQ
jgi:hydroxypyruvate isomerase